MGVELTIATGEKADMKGPWHEALALGCANRAIEIILTRRTMMEVQVMDAQSILDFIVRISYSNDPDEWQSWW